MPTAARLLGVGLAGASVLSVYLLAKLGLSLAGASLHVPNITVLAFGATLVGLFALSQLSFGTTAPASLLVGVFLFNQLAVLGTGVEMNAIAHVSWFAMIALATYIVARSYPTPSPTARLGATVLAATGFAQLVVAVCWDRLAILAASGHPGALHLMDFLGNGLLALYLAAALSLAACFFLARQQLLETAPVPPEVPEGHDVARCCCR